MPRFNLTTVVSADSAVRVETASLLHGVVVDAARIAGSVAGVAAEVNGGAVVVSGGAAAPSAVEVGILVVAVLTGLRRYIV